MKTIFISILLLSSFIMNTSLSNSEEEVSQAVEKLFKAMEDGDENVLDQLLSKDLSYGHSSGNVQDKAAFVEEVVSRKPLHLKNIKGKDQTITISSDVAIVRHNFVAIGTNASGQDTPISIGNCMVWVKIDGNWKLLVRQAFKLS